MIATISKTFFSVSLSIFLVACGGGSGFPETAPSTQDAQPGQPGQPGQPAQYGQLVRVEQPGQALQPALGAPEQERLVKAGNILASVEPVDDKTLAAMSEEERQIYYEQMFSIEMNRRHEEQLARERKAAELGNPIWAPGCEVAESAEQIAECKKAWDFTLQKAADLSSAENAAE